MKKIILASMLYALSAFVTSKTQAQSLSHTDTMQNENKSIRPMAAQSTGYEGMWQGVLKTPEGSRRVVLDIARRPNGDGLIGNMVTSAQSPYSVLVDSFTMQDRHIILDMKTANSAFEGNTNRDMTEIKGMWTREGKSLPLTLKRMDITARDSKGNAYGSQSQTLGTSRNVDDQENPSSPYQQRRTPAFRIAPPRWFAWYEWTPRPGNQDVPYGTYYW